MNRSQPSRRHRSDPNRQLSARTLQLFGLLLIGASAVFWAFTQEESALLVGAGVTLSTLGWLQRTIDRIQARLPTYDAPPEPEFIEVDERRRERRGR